MCDRLGMNVMRLGVGQAGNEANEVGGETGWERG